MPRGVNKTDWTIIQHEIWPNFHFLPLYRQPTQDLSAVCTTSKVNELRKNKNEINRMN